ncbi:MAG TPA: hypothetical protein VFC51_12125 [Chloroflexota bacterium]|nr:hypothetical protein [Chloroflexota bacterium]
MHGYSQATQTGEMRLAVEGDPPWDRRVYRAAAFVAVIDRHHRAGKDAFVVKAATDLDTLLYALRADRHVACLTS